MGSWGSLEVLPSQYSALTQRMEMNPQRQQLQILYLLEVTRELLPEHQPSFSRKALQVQVVN